MSTHIRLSRSPAYWALVIVSLLLVAAGAVLALPRILTMEQMLVAMTATGVEVYVGQAWVTLAAGLIGAGAVGLLLALGLAAAKALLTPRANVVALPDDGTDVQPDATDVQPADEASDIGRTPVAAAPEPSGAAEGERAGLPASAPVTR